VKTSLAALVAIWLVEVFRRRSYPSRLFYILRMSEVKIVESNRDSQSGHDKAVGRQREFVTASQLRNCTRSIGCGGALPAGAIL
jgi:hypothetical protein